MFDWIVELLYGVTKSILRLIDGLVSCCNKLSGIEEVTIDGVDTDFMRWIISLEGVQIGFKAAALVCIFLVVFFTIWQIIKTIVSEKPEKSPAQLCISAGKAVLTFMFIPVIMIVLVWALNEVALVMYNGTSGGSSKGIGTFLAAAFGESALYDSTPKDFYLDPNFDYTDTTLMETYMDLWDYDFFYSWVAGIAILLAMVKALMIFIDRVFSIAILFIISPFPVAAAVVDEGQHFKMWRDQLLAKFLVGYGALIGLNIYGIVVAALATSDIEFFGSSFLNFLFKLIIILGGTVALSRISAMIGNLVSQGAGDAEGQAAGQMASGIEGVGKQAFGLAKKGASLLGKKLGIGGGAGKEGDGKSGDGKGKGEGGGGSGNKNPNPQNPSKGGGFLGALKSGFNKIKSLLSGKKDKDKDKKDKDKDKDNDKGNKKESLEQKFNDRLKSKGVVDNLMGGNKK